MMTRGTRKVLLTMFPFLLSSMVFAAGAGGKGQGAIVIRDDAPVYKKSDGDEIAWKLQRGDSVAAYGGSVTSSMFGGGDAMYIFDEKSGRVRVVYFQGEQKGMNKIGWMNPPDLSRFTYDGSCERGASPFATKGFSVRWNACFHEARDSKLEELKAKWGKEDAGKPVTQEGEHP